MADVPPVLSDTDVDGFHVGGPRNAPSPLASRASSSPARSMSCEEQISSHRRRNRFVRPPYDLRLLDYAAAVDANLVCPICHAPFASPKRLECDHVFCDDCLQRTFEQTQRGSPTRSCPTCRRRLQDKEKAVPIPRILSRMLDELVVRCPNEKKGCSWADKRVDVQDHVDLYCGFTVVECPAPECELGVRQKDVHMGCLHYFVPCVDCESSLMQKDLDAHQTSRCPKRTISCLRCSATVLRRDLQRHLDDTCPLTQVSCPGSSYGCLTTAPRAEIAAHTNACSIALMAPFLRAQAEKQEEQIEAQSRLQRKLNVLEGGLSNIQSLLYPEDPTCDAGRPPNALVAAPTSTETAPSTSSALPNATIDDSSQAMTTATGTTASVIDQSSAHHLLTLHESLRDEMSRIGGAIAELDARCEVRVMNETLRFKEDMAHANAAINGLRAQVHWLTSQRLLQRSAGVGMAGGGPAGGGRGDGGGSGGASGGSASEGGPSVGEMGMRRKSSDTGRQDTKL